MRRGIGEKTNEWIKHTMRRNRKGRGVWKYELKLLEHGLKSSFEYYLEFENEDLELDLFWPAGGELNAQTVLII